MHSSHDLDLDSFRHRVRHWLEANLDPSFVTSAAAEQAQHNRDVQRRLHADGLAGLAVPTRYGGRGLSQLHERIFDEEVARHGVPLLQQGISTCLPTLLAHASEAIKERHVPSILRGDEVWVQLLSEPAAGTDLAGLVSTAVRDGDDFVLHGIKTWINGAQFADYGTCLARTDPSVVKHRGLTMFVVYLRAPRVTVRPLRKLTGELGFCEVVLDDVRVGADMVVGAVDGGWSVARTQMRGEQNTAGAQGRTGVPDLVSDMVRSRVTTGLDTRTADLVANLYVRSLVEAETVTRVRRAIALGRMPTAAAAIVKLIRVWRAQQSAADVMDVYGLDGVAWAPTDRDAELTSFDYLGHRPRSVSGGTSEIQLNNISERVLNLPREPRADMDRSVNPSAGPS